MGANSVPSSLFCCLYKLMLMHLTEKQVQALLKYRQNPFVRACGALFVRYLSPHEQLWDRLQPWLLDEQQFHHSADKGRASITFGEYCEAMIADKNYFNTVLPRIPVLLNRELLKKLADLPEKRKRREENQAKGHLIKKGLVLYALSKKDGQWHKAKVAGVHYLNPYPKAEDEETVAADEEEEPNEDDYEEVKIVRKLQVIFLDVSEGD